MNVELARHQMVEQQVRSWDVIDDRTLDVMTSVRRELFVPEGWQEAAFADARIPLGYGQWMDLPKMDGRILQAMQINTGDRVFEIGTGSGYLAACMAGCGGDVTSIERIEELVAFSRDNLRNSGITGVKVEHRDASEQLPKQRYDVVVAGGSVAGSLATLEQLLTVGGRLFVVHGTGPAMAAMRIERMAEERWFREALFETEVAPLHGFGPTPQFEF